jgi:hypothetical protein
LEKYIDIIKRIKYNGKMKIGKYNNIKDLAPTFIENFTENDVSKNIYTEYANKIEMYKNDIGIFNKYFFYHLHDSKIISLENIHNNLYLRLNDMATFEFACALIDKFSLKINRSRMIFPLEIISEETVHLSLKSVDINGTLCENKFVDLKEYLYEEIIEWNKNNMEIAFDLCNMNLTPYRYVLLLHCKKLIINENQNEYWEKYFGGKTLIKIMNISIWNGTKEIIFRIMSNVQN